MIEKIVQVKKLRVIILRMKTRTIMSGAKEYEEVVKKHDFKNIQNEVE